MTKIVAYLRVSTNKQGVSGLGLEAQRAEVESYAVRTGAEIIAEYVEVESGRKKHRPELRKAIDEAELSGAALVVAKLDRLARDVAFITELQKSGLDFVACDFPAANKMMIQMLAVVAEYEAELISKRTKAALQAAKARGTKLGGPALERARESRTGDVTADANRERAERADQWAGKVARFIERARTEIEEEGKNASLAAVAGYLNTNTAIKTRRGGQWTPAAVGRVLERVG